MFTENLKQFLGSTWKGRIAKIILGLILFAIATIVRALTWRTLDYFPSGWPFIFSESMGPCPPGYSCSNSNILALIADIVFWYLILCLVIFAFKKIRSKKELIVKEQTL